MPIHFTPEEMQDRKDRTARAIAASGLDALLMFKQESMYWLTGYDTFGFSSFQCMAMTADGRIALLNRAPDRGTAAYTPTSPTSASTETLTAWTRRSTPARCWPT